MGMNRTLAAVVVVAPYFVEKRFVRHHPVLVVCKERENLKLLEGKGQFPLCPKSLEGLAVKAEGTKANLFLQTPLRRSRASTRFSSICMEKGFAIKSSAMLSNARSSFESPERAVIIITGTSLDFLKFLSISWPFMPGSMMSKIAR